MLTDKVVKALKPPDTGQTIKWDNEVRGFGVRITSNGIVAFLLDYRFNGTKRRYTIGRYPEWSVEAARKEALKLRHGIDQGEDPLEERREEFAAPTVRDLARDYMERHSKIHKRS